MSETVIKIKLLSAGQPKPYADSVYSAEISAERHGVFTNNKVLPGLMDQAEVEMLVEMFVHHFVPDYKNPGWHEPTLKEIRPLDVVEEGKSARWFVKVVLPFTD